MPKKLRLSPLQGRILWLLEEAGKETLGTVLATLRMTDDWTFRRELEALVRHGFVRQGEEAGQQTLILTGDGRVALNR
jgi:DNA-binding IclR family transcriptional regulator